MKLAKSEAGISLMECLIAVVVLSGVVMGAYRLLYMPYKMSRLLNDTTQQQIPVQALDIVVADLQQADGSSVPVSEIDPRTGMLPGGDAPAGAWIRQTHLEATPPYTFIQYAFIPTANRLGNLVRYACSVGIAPTIAHSTMSVVLTSMAQPASSLPGGGVAPPFLAQPDAANMPNLLEVSVDYQPAAAMSATGPAVFRASRRVALRN